MSRLGHFASAYTQPDKLFEAPVKAAQQLMDKGRFHVDEVDMWMLTEAFGNQAVQNAQALCIDSSRLNLFGGAIALGHPIGFSGLGREFEAAFFMYRTGGVRRAIAGACGGGGRGTVHEHLPV